MKTSNYQIEDGLIVDPSTTPPTCCGYIINFPGHGNYSPDGMVNFTEEQCREHNRLLAVAELDGLKLHGRGTLYLKVEPQAARRQALRGAERKLSDVFIDCQVGNWSGTYTTPGRAKATSRGCSRRGYDVWFTGPDGKSWYGINMGDSQILRVRRLKH